MPLIKNGNSKRQLEIAIKKTFTMGPAIPTRSQEREQKRPAALEELSNVYDAMHQTRKR